MRERKDIKSWEAKAEELEQSPGKYLINPAREGTFNPFATTRGYVWLFVRK
jgi:hypothetical protein